MVSPSPLKIGQTGQLTQDHNLVSQAINHEVIANSESSNKEIQLSLINLSRQMLQKIYVNPSNGTSEFYFDLGGKLSTTPIEIEDEQWMIYNNLLSKVFTYRGDGYYSDELVNKSESDNVWLPFIAGQ